MTPHMALYISPLVVSAAVLVALLVVTWRSRSDPVAPWFAATMVAFLIWTVGYACELVATSLAGKLWWADFQFVGIAVLPVVWFEVVRRYTGHGPLPRWSAASLGAFVAASVAVFLTNPAGIFRGSPTLDTATAPAVVVPDYGWYWAAFFMPVAYLLLAATVLLLAHAWWRDRHSLYRRQYALLIVAILLPVVGRYAVRDRPGAGAGPEPDHRGRQRLRRDRRVCALPLPAVPHRAAGARDGRRRALGRRDRARHVRPHRRLQSGRS